MGPNDNNQTGDNATNKQLFTSGGATTTGNNLFNNAVPTTSNMPQMNQPPAHAAPEPSVSNQPFFGFSNEAPNANTAPQMPQNQGMNQGMQGTQGPQGNITPTAPISPVPVTTIKTPASPQYTIKKLTFLSIFLGVTAIICLFLGIWGLIDAINTRNQLATSNQNLSTYSAIVGELEKQTGTTINVVEDLPVYQASGDYVYITGWNVKLKIPDTLTSISYVLNQNADYHSNVCFTGVQKGVQYYPTFADINQNRNGLGCLYRITITDGEKDNNGNSYGQKIFTSGDYNYFYKETPLYSASDADKGLETTARDLVKQMIVADISTYK